jgi:hypothetical protein
MSAGRSFAIATRPVSRSRTQQSGSDQLVGLNRLQKLTLDQLRQEWRSLLNEQAPYLRSRDLVLRILAWKLQAREHGGLSARVARRLKDLEAAFAKDPHHTPAPLLSLLPGSVLVREWKGVTHRVLIEQTAFVYDGCRYASLTDVARKITCTAWSGPRFFGLERKAKELGRRP